LEGGIALLAYVGRRLVSMIPGLLGITVITFIISHILPGNPALMMAGDQSTPEEIEKFKVSMGLNKPLFVQFFNYLDQLVHGNLGFAWHTGHSVSHDFLTRIPATIELTLASLVIAVVVAIPVGVFAAVRKESVFDHIARVFSLIGACTPGFWLGLMLIYIFYAKLGWAPPPLGRIGQDVNSPTHITGLYVVDSLVSGDMEALRSTLSHLVLPASGVST